MKRDVCLCMRAMHGAFRLLVNKSHAAFSEFLGTLNPLLWRHDETFALKASTFGFVMIAITFVVLAGRHQVFV